MVRPVLQAGVEQVFVTLDDLGPAAEPALSAWPNPAQDALTLAWSGLERAERWSIVDLSGRVFRMGVWPQGMNRFPCSVADLPRGMALVVVETTEGRRELQRIVLH